MVECLPGMRKEGPGFNPIHKCKRQRNKNEPKNKQTKAKRGQTTRRMCGLKGKEAHSSKFFLIVSNKQ